jgi:hypothetical protein
MVPVGEIEDKRQEPEVSVASLGEARSRRARRSAMRPTRRPRQNPDISVEEGGYEYTLDLAETVNLPDEDGKPRPDEILARYTPPLTTAPHTADNDQPSSDEEHTDRGQLGPPGDEQPVADEILAAISELPHGPLPERVEICVRVRDGVEHEPTPVRGRR